MSVYTTVQFKVKITKSGKFSDRESLGNLRSIAVREAEATLRKIIGCSPKDICLVGNAEIIDFIYSEDL